ncbi:MAG TPA: aminoacyl-tRNA hydrolase [Bryobacteraceae bacterium]|jgi:PTH1 family peptidyl-tRNA hydrolase|nr:aminoacyl-tRNA hydrolase [Bryobacteraceae bacterium]
MSQGPVLVQDQEGELPPVRWSGPRNYCVVGLGNPGVRYQDTPHNLGFRVIEELAKRHFIRISRNEGIALTGNGKIRDNDVLLVKPQTFMNNSGAGIHGVLKSRRMTNKDLIVVYDELDLPWTALRIKKNGSAAGHNGVKSIIAALKTDVFLRVRVGIRPNHPVEDAAAYVLAPFERELKEDVSEVVTYTADAIEFIVAEGAIRAMAKFNRRARGIQEEEQ